MANNGTEAQVLAAVTGFLDSISGQETPLAETRKHVLPSAYAVDWRAHCGELIQTPPNEYVAEMERRLNRMRSDGLRSFVQTLTTAEGDLPSPRVWVDAGQGIAAVWAGFAMKSNGEEKYRGVGAFTLYHRSRQTEEGEGEKCGGEGWKIAAFVDARWDSEYFRPRPMTDAQATEDLLAAARVFTDLQNSGKEEPSGVALQDAVLPGCITHRLDESGLQSLLFQDLLLVDNSKAKVAGQQQQWQRKVDVLDGEGRVVAGVGLLWMHYTVAMLTSRAGDEQTKTQGTATLTFLQKDGKWLVSGVQEAEHLNS
ncbi:hypothetical protein PGQ11_003980 [Apiospora arundinis]|uniref:SnoaL-like domain-containing protein n=1 Tax=Apiospora arundinis TaxID=335852 RepID=A0ABR2J6Q2_9PEZI